MSVDSAKSFMSRVMRDEDFASQIGGAGGQEERLQAIKDAGYDFTPDDLKGVLPAGVTLDQLQALEGMDELPDALMEAVVGGKRSKPGTVEIVTSAVLAGGAVVVGAASAAAV
jgi:predicted ribosomally synthesized peptide with nif11-like leader